jgi:chemotaxis protein CheY-P-specific phosphatase CheC
LKLSDMDKDILVEIANVGAGNATTPLSKIFDT